MTPMEATALSGIAALMRNLVRSPRATFSYDMLSDALIWSDEFPKPGVLAQVPGWDVIRFVLHFRTTLILGEPYEEYREYWDEALRLFPEWPGFAPERRSSELRADFREKSAWARAELDELEREMDQHAGDPAGGG